MTTNQKIEQLNISQAGRLCSLCYSGNFTDDKSYSHLRARKNNVTEIVGRNHLIKG